MARSFNRPKPKKYEKHHIIPKSFGGNEEKWNTAYLTLREHFIAHLLLVKITIGNNKFKMLNALMRMSNSKDNKYNLKSRHYEKIRKDFSKEKSKSMMGSGNPNWGKTPTKEHIEKLVKSQPENDNTPMPDTSYVVHDVKEIQNIRNFR